MEKVIIVACLALVLIMSGCATTGQSSVYSGKTFQQACRETGGMWMIMEPTENYVPTGAPACAGCMLRDGDHICDMSSYLKALKKTP